MLDFLHYYEENIKLDINYIKTYYWSLPIIISISYLLMIIGLKKYMRYREPYKLKYSLFIWNLSLSIFSLLGFLRVFTNIKDSIFNNDDTIINNFLNSICNFERNSLLIFWASLFIISKIVEFGDTVFLLLKKRTVIFLHWYHHLTVFLYLWNSYIEETVNNGRWFMCMNFFIHFIMYLYYSIQSLKIINIPRIISKTITILQITQMAIGIIICLINYYYSIYNNCIKSWFNLNCGLIMYISYFILFYKFFIDTYKSKKKVN